MNNDASKKRNSRLIFGTTVLTIGNILSKTLALISVVLITKWVSIENYGKYDLINSYSGLILPLLTLAIYEALFRFILDKNDSRLVFTNCSAIVFVGVTFLILGAVISWSLKNKVGFFVFLYFVCFIIFSYLQYMLRGVEKLKEYSITNVAFSIFSLFFVYLFVRLAGFALTGLLLGNIVAYLITIIYEILIIPIKKYISLESLKLSNMISFVKYSMPLVFVSMSWWVMSVSDRTIIKIYLGDNYNGIYAVANKIPVILSALYGAFQYTWTEVAVKGIGEEDIGKWFNDVFNRILSLMISSAIVILSFNEFIFKMVFGEEYYTARYYMPILLIAIVALEVATFFGGIYIANKNTYKQSISFIVAAIINIFVNFLLISKIGLYAAAGSTLVANLILLLWRYIDTNYIYHWRISKKNMLLTLLLLLSVVISELILNEKVFLFIIIACIIAVISNVDLIKKPLNRVKRKR